MLYTQLNTLYILTGLSMYWVCSQCIAWVGLAFCAWFGLLVDINLLHKGISSALSCAGLLGLILKSLVWGTLDRQVINGWKLVHNWLDQCALTVAHNGHHIFHSLTILMSTQGEPLEMSLSWWRRCKPVYMTWDPLCTYLGILVDINLSCACLPGHVFKSSVWG